MDSNFKKMENGDKENIQKKEDAERLSEQKNLSASEENLGEGKKEMIKPFIMKDTPGFENIEKREKLVKPFTTMDTPVAGNIKEKGEANPGILEKNESETEEFNVQDVKIMGECQKNPCETEGGIQPQINDFVDTNMISDHDHPGGIVDVRSSEILKNEIRDSQDSGEEKTIEHETENEKNPQDIREKIQICCIYAQYNKFRGKLFRWSKNFWKISRIAQI